MGARRAPAARPPARPPARRPASTSARTPPARAAPATPAPMQKSAPAKSGGMLSGIGSTIMQGMAFGTGSAMAHQAVGAAVGAMSGGGSSGEEQQQEYAPEHAQQPAAAAANNSTVCVNDKELFFDCIKVNNGDAQTCSFLYEQLQQCQNNATQFQSFQ